MQGLHVSARWPQQSTSGICRLEGLTVNDVDCAGDMCVTYVTLDSHGLLPQCAIAACTMAAAVPRSSSHPVSDRAVADSPQLLEFAVKPK